MYLKTPLGSRAGRIRLRLRRRVRTVPLAQLFVHTAIPFPLALSHGTEALSALRTNPRNCSERKTFSASHKSPPPRDYTAFMLVLVVVSFGSAIAGALLTWYLQRRWTPDPAAEVVALQKQVAALHKQVAAFQQQAKTMEEERAKFEQLPLDISLYQGAPGSYIANVRNESEHEISIETIQILRGDSADDCPLSETAKPRPTDDWKLAPRAGKQLCWAPQNDPAMMLRSLDPNLKKGTVIPVVFALTFRADGRLLNKRRTQLVFVSGNCLSPWGP